jgi:hypothetical protein
MLMLHRKACNFFRLGVYTSLEMRDIYSETETNATTQRQQKDNSTATPLAIGAFLQRLPSKNVGTESYGKVRR